MVYGLLSVSFICDAAMATILVVGNFLPSKQPPLQIALTGMFVRAIMGHLNSILQYECTV